MYGFDFHTKFHILSLNGSSPPTHYKLNTGFTQLPLACTLQKLL